MKEATEDSSLEMPDATIPVPGTRGNSLVSDIHSLLNDDDISDITLIPLLDMDGTSFSHLSNPDGNDNSPVSCSGVPAVKAILAARSPVFRRMLYGEFRETTSNNDNLQVRLEYSERVLQLLVEFCFTDRMSSLDGVNSSSNNSCGGSTYNLEEKARLLTNLSGAAHYFDITKLEADIKRQLVTMMADHPSLACAVLDEASKILSGEELSLLALERIRARPKAALLPWSNFNSGGSGASISALSPRNSLTSGRGGIVSLNASLLEQVVFDEKSTASEMTKFLCLQKWVEGSKQEVVLEELPRKQTDPDECEKVQSPPSSPNKVSCNDETPSMDSISQDSHHQKKVNVAKALAQKLDLSLISASDLSTTITDSQLLSTHDLYQAYRLQALNAERTKSKVFVEGAGLSEVNGTYIQGGVHEGTPMYNKEGVWRDREEVFRIFLCTYSNGNKSWCISIVPKGKQPGKTTDLDFYECPVSYGKVLTGHASMTGGMENGLGVVPSRGWKLVNYGQPPVPKCSLIAGCLEDA
mmetsp:Transcript_6856/g.14047  ORF Transcript_6856/g.14047 Transcript_6856/m.14047 type:complete len:526 (-) Transcript_6856:151-1728(-)